MERPKRFAAAILMLAAAVAAVSGCGGGASEKAAVRTRLPAGRDASGVSTAPAPGSPGRFDAQAVRACSDVYLARSAWRTIDLDPPKTPAAAAAGARGHLDGRVVGLDLRPGAASTLTAEINGKPQPVNFESTMLVLTVDVTAVTGDVTGVAPGDRVEIPQPFINEVPGAPIDPAADLRALNAACPIGLGVTAYAVSASGSQVRASGFATLLVADDGTFSPLAPSRSRERPFGAATVAEFEAATG
ncbi:MAG: hypothetical protein HYX34_09845 [Actinobacteria bacterium]|nr:hypothetical protein [Actinomycetota bacterium]